jgi:hypothetical protein
MQHIKKIFIGFLPLCMLITLIYFLTINEIAHKIIGIGLLGIGFFLFCYLFGDLISHFLLNRKEK